MKAGVVILFFALLTLNPAHGGETVTLDSLINDALKNNPKIKSAKYRFESALTKIKLLRNLKDPLVEYEYGNTGTEMNMHNLTLSQEIPWPTKLMLNKDMYQKEANALEQEYKEIEKEIIRDVKQAYFQLFLIDKKISITKEILNLLSQFVGTTTRKYSVGKAKQIDVLRAQVEYSKHSNQIVLLEQDRIIANATLNYLTNKTGDSTVISPQIKTEWKLNLTESEIIKIVRENRAELKAFREMMDKSKIELEMKKQEYFPDIMLKHKRSLSSVNDWSLMVGLNLPLWFWEKQTPSVEEANSNVEQANSNYEAIENMVVLEVKTSFEKLKSAQNLVKIYETGVLPQIQASLETARLGYEADKIDFLELLDILRTYNEFEIEYFESMANLEIAIADLEYAIGKQVD